MESLTTTVRQQLSTENLINAIQNEAVIWNSDVNASEEEKDLAWHRAGDYVIAMFKVAFRAYIIQFCLRNFFRIGSF